MATPPQRPRSASTPPREPQSPTRSRRSSTAGNPESGSANGSRWTPRTLPSGEVRLFATLDELRADPRNARAHPPRQIAELRSSFRNFGQQRPIVVDSTGKLLAGHGFLEALRLENAAEAWITLANLDRLRAQAFAIADNRTAELGEWDAALLADALAELGQLEPELVRATGFDDRELAEIVDDLDRATAAAAENLANAERPRAPSTPTSAVPDPDAPKREYSMQDRPPLLATGPALSRTGDVWTFGQHRLACGDARDRALVGLVLAGVESFVLLTDPPYCSGSSQEAGKAAGTFGDIAADNLSAQGFRELISQALAASGAQSAYLFTDWRQWPNLIQIVEGSGLAGRAMIVWDKGSPGIGAFWRPAHELVLFATRKSSKRAPGAVGLGNVLRFPRARNLHHYTEKPVELLARILKGDEATGRVGVAVYDSFAGSGSTLIAAARAGRRGLGIEVEPLIVDTALRRLRDEFTAARGREGIPVDPAPVLERWSGWKGEPPRSFDAVATERLGHPDKAPEKPAAKSRKAKSAARSS